MSDILTSVRRPRLTENNDGSTDRGGIAMTDGRNGNLGPTSTFDTDVELALEGSRVGRGRPSDESADRTRRGAKRTQSPTVDNSEGNVKIPGRLGEEKVRIELEKSKIRRKITDYPKGIARLAVRQSSGDNLAMTRLLKHSHNYALLQLQLEIFDIEKELLESEHIYGREDHTLNDSQPESSRNDNRNEKRKSMLKTFIETLLTYDDLVLKFARMSALTRPTEGDYLSLFNYVVCSGAVEDKYLECWYAKDDFIRVKDPHINKFDQQLQRFVGWSHGHRWIMRPFQTRNEDRLNTTPEIMYYSADRFKVFVKVLSVCIAVGVLLVPVYLLFLVEMTRGVMAAVTSVFLALFTVITSFMTDAKLETVFIGAATYGAVLIVFLGNVSQGCSGVVPVS